MSDGITAPCPHSQGEEIKLGTEQRWKLSNLSEISSQNSNSRSDSGASGLNPFTINTCTKATGAGSCWPVMLHPQPEEESKKHMHPSAHRVFSTLTDSGCPALGMLPPKVGGSFHLT